MGLDAWVKIGGMTTIGTVSYASFKIFLMGLFISGAFYVSGPTTVGVDAVAQLDDVNLDSIGISIPVPVSAVKDVTVSWEIFAPDGSLINSDSYYIEKLNKGEPIFLKKEIELNKNVDDIKDITVKVTFDGHIGSVHIDRTEIFDVSTSELLEGYEYEV